MRDLFEKNPFLEKVSAGKAPVGFFNYLRDTAVLDIAGTVGFDFVVIDNEHTGMERETTEKLILAAELNQVVPFVRVPELIPYLMRNYMEMGARGVLVPHIRSGAECRMAQDTRRKTIRRNPFDGRLPLGSRRPQPYADTRLARPGGNLCRNLSGLPLQHLPQPLRHGHGPASRPPRGREQQFLRPEDRAQALSVRRGGCPAAGILERRTDLEHGGKAGCPNRLVLLGR